MKPQSRPRIPRRQRARRRAGAAKNGGVRRGVPWYGWLICGAFFAFALAMGANMYVTRNIGWMAPMMICGLGSMAALDPRNWEDPWGDRGDE